MPSRSTGAIVCLGVALALSACSKDSEQAKREYMERGDRYAAEKNVDAAIIEYRNAVQQDPQFAEAYQKLAAAYVTRGDAPDALRTALMAADLMPDSADAQIEAGHLLLLGGRFADAKTRAEKALAKDARNVRARILLGNATAGLKDIDTAVREFEQAIRLDPQQSGIYTGLAALKATQGEREAAERAFRQAIETDATSATARLALAQFYWSTDRLAEAERTLKEAQAAAPDDARTHVSLAVFYQGTRRAAEAEPYLRRAVQTDRSPRLAIVLADYYIGRNRLADARPLLQPLATDRRFGALASLRLAGIAQIQGDADEALQIVEATLTGHPKNAMVLAAKSDVLRQQQKLDDALKAADEGVAANPSSVEAHFARGNALAARGNDDEAARAFEEVLRLNPRTAAARIHLARLRLRNDATEAAMLATQATQLEPRNVDARLTLARALTQKKQYGEALKILDELVASTPDIAAVHAQRGTLLARKSDQAGARAAFGRALELNPSQAEALDGITAIDFATGRQSEAIARLEGLVQRGPEQVSVRMAAARAYATANRFVEAESQLLSVIEADPSDLDAYSMLGTIYLQQNRVAAARAQFEKLVAKQPRSVPGWTVIGTIDLMEARTADAQRAFERVLEINPKSGVAANNLAWIYAEHGGSLDAALQLAQVASRELPNDAEVNDTLGWIYFKKGMVELSIATLRRSLELDPQNAQAAYHLALAYDKRGDRDQARQMLSRYLTLDSTSARSAEVKRRLEASTGT